MKLGQKTKISANVSTRIKRLISLFGIDLKVAIEILDLKRIKKLLNFFGLAVSFLKRVHVIALT